MSELEEIKLNPDLTKKDDDDGDDDKISLSISDIVDNKGSSDDNMILSHDDTFEQVDDDDDDDEVLSSSPVPSVSSEDDTTAPIVISDTDEDDDSDDEIEADMLKKLEKDTYEDILLNYHPEIKQNNYNEILAMCKIVRDRGGIISDALHRTLPWLTKYERARVLGLRSKQLSNGADAFIEIPPGMISGYKIAVEELNQKKIPFIIRRPIPNGGNEYWKLDDLKLLNSY